MSVMPASRRSAARPERRSEVVRTETRAGRNWHVETVADFARDGTPPPCLRATARPRRRHMQKGGDPQASALRMRRVRGAYRSTTIGAVTGVPLTAPRT